MKERKTTRELLETWTTNSSRASCPPATREPRINFFLRTLRNLIIRQCVLLLHCMKISLFPICKKKVYLKTKYFSFVFVMSHYLYFQFPSLYYLLLLKYWNRWLYLWSDSEKPPPKKVCQIRNTEILNQAHKGKPGMGQPFFCSAGPPCVPHTLKMP